MNWKTVPFDITPISYAQCGLYPQFHRREEHIYSNIEYLRRKLYGGKLIRNVPNKHLEPGVSWTPPCSLEGDLNP